MTQEHPGTGQGHPGKKVVKRHPGKVVKRPLEKTAGLPGITARPRICKSTPILIIDIIDVCMYECLYVCIYECMCACVYICILE
jgi:hypothetical protein